MKNFKQQYKRAGDYEYIYRTAEIGEAVEIRMYYMKDSKRRGIKLTMNNVTIKDEGGWQSVSMMLMDGLLVHVYDLPKKSNNALDHAAEWFDSKVEKLAELWTGLGKAEFTPILFEVIRFFNAPDHPATVTPAATAEVTA